MSLANEGILLFDKCHRKERSEQRKQPERFLESCRRHVLAVERLNFWKRLWEPSLEEPYRQAGGGKHGTSLSRRCFLCSSLPQGRRAGGSINAHWMPESSKNPPQRLDNLNPHPPRAFYSNITQDSRRCVFLRVRILASLYVARLIA